MSETSKRVLRPVRSSEWASIGAREAEILAREVEALEAERNELRAKLETAERRYEGLHATAAVEQRALSATIAELETALASTERVVWLAVGRAISTVIDACDGVAGEHPALDALADELLPALRALEGASAPAPRAHDAQDSSGSGGEPVSASADVAPPEPAGDEASSD